MILENVSDVPSVWENTVLQRERLPHEKHEGQLPHVSGGTSRHVHAVFTQAATFPSDFTSPQFSRCDVYAAATWMMLLYVLIGTSSQSLCTHAF